MAVEGSFGAGTVNLSSYSRLVSVRGPQSDRPALPRLGNMYWSVKKVVPRNRFALCVRDYTEGFFVYTGRKGIWPLKRPRPGTASRGKGLPYSMVCARAVRGNLSAKLSAALACRREDEHSLLDYHRIPRRIKALA